MSRLTPCVLSLLLLTPQIGNGDENQVGRCTIVNTADHPIVIGLYKPSENGISEKLVSVPPRTELYDVPIPVTDDAQFVIAYCATMEGDKVRRANPIQIYGHQRLRFLKDKRHQLTRDAMIEYRGGYDPRSAFDGNHALWLPGSQVEAQSVLKRANQRSTPVPPPLTRTKFVDGSNSHQAERGDGGETK